MIFAVCCFMVCLTIIVLGSLFCYVTIQEHKEIVSEERYEILLSKYDDLLDHYKCLYFELDELEDTVNDLLARN